MSINQHLLPWQQETYFVSNRGINMPLLIKDYTWRQTNDLVIITVPLKGVPHSKVDIFTSENYIKLHFPPFLFELCLAHTIQEDASRCVLTRDEAVFELLKDTKEQWELLHADLTKHEILALKQQAIEKHHEKEENRKQEKQKEKSQRQKLSVRQQIVLDTKEREYINTIRNNERNIAMKDFENWKKQQELSVKITEITEDHEKGKGQGKSIFTEKDVQNSAVTRKKYYTNRTLTNKITEETVSKPRMSGAIKVKFTPRAFPTPCRESKLAEEEEWLRKQAEVRRKTGFIAEDLRPEEQNPDWLKDKADSFYKVGNYLGAISAYSHGIKLNNKMHSLYIGRAATHLALDNLHRVIDDTTTALELLVPCVSQNAGERSKCHVLRGKALIKLNLMKPALTDLETALSITPECIELQNTVKEIKTGLQRGHQQDEEEEEEEEEESLEKVKQT